MIGKIITPNRAAKVSTPQEVMKIVHAGTTLRVCETPIAFRDRARGRSKMSIDVALRFFFRWLIAFFRRALRQTPLAFGSEKRREASVSQFADKP